MLQTTFMVMSIISLPQLALILVRAHNSILTWEKVIIALAYLRALVKHVIYISKSFNTIPAETLGSNQWRGCCINWKPRTSKSRHNTINKIAFKLESWCSVKECEYNQKLLKLELQLPLKNSNRVGRCDIHSLLYWHIGNSPNQISTVSHFIFEIITPSITKAMNGYFMMWNVVAKTMKIALSCMNLQQLIILVFYMMKKRSCTYA